MPPLPELPPLAVSVPDWKPALPPVKLMTPPEPEPEPFAEIAGPEILAAVIFTMPPLPFPVPLLEIGTAQPKVDPALKLRVPALPVEPCGRTEKSSPVK